MASASRVTVVGSANVDHVIRLPTLPQVGQTVLGGPYFRVWGGKGANQAVSAARLGADVAFIACLGDDSTSNEMLGSLATEDIDLACVRQVAGRPSGVALILVDAAGRNSIAVDPGTNAELSVDDIDRAAGRIASSEVLVLQNETPAAAALHAARIARLAGVRTLLNYAPYTPGLEALAAELLVVNELEAMGLTGVDVVDAETATEAAELCRQRGFSDVVVTLGAGGALVLASGDRVLVPAEPVEAVDTTAAGDTFCGALATAVADGRPLVDAARFATAAAALCVSRAGAQPSVPHRAEVQTLLASRGG